MHFSKVWRDDLTKFGRERDDQITIMVKEALFIFALCRVPKDPSYMLCCLGHSS